MFAGVIDYIYSINNPSGHSRADPFRVHHCYIWCQCTSTGAFAKFTPVTATATIGFWICNIWLGGSMQHLTKLCYAVCEHPGSQYCSAVWASECQHHPRQYCVRLSCCRHICAVPEWWQQQCCHICICNEEQYLISFWFVLSFCHLHNPVFNSKPKCSDRYMLPAPLVPHLFIVHYCVLYVHFCHCPSWLSAHWLGVVSSCLYKTKWLVRCPVCCRQHKLVRYYHTRHQLSLYLLQLTQLISVCQVISSCCKGLSTYSDYNL